MTARPVNPAKPDLSSEARSAKEEGRSGAPPSAMVAEVAAAIWAKSHGDCGTWNEIPDHWKPPFYEQAIAAIAAMFDNLPRAEMAEAACRADCEHIGQDVFCNQYGCKIEAFDGKFEKQIDAAISASRAEVLGSAKDDA